MTKEAIANTNVNNISGERMVNLDLLRSVAMMLVVVLHYLGKGNLLGELTNPEMLLTEGVAWFLEALAIVAVNVYMLLSGYFVSTSSFKVSRLLRLWLQLEFYSVVVGSVAILAGWVPAEEVNTYFLLGLLFPVSMGHYWFMTAYIYLYLLFALFGPVLKKLDKKQMQLILAFLFTVFCLIKSFVPVRFEMDELGYDCLWYLCMFLLGAYIRRYGLPVLTGKLRSAVLYILACCVIFAGTMLMRTVYLRTGSLSYIIDFLYDYNHIANVLAAVGLFGLFLHMRLPDGLGRLAGRIAPYTLGVYLLHENQAVRYLWQNLLGADRINTVPGLLLGVLIAVVIVFIAGILADVLRSKVMGLTHKVLSHVKLYHKLTEKIYEWDGVFASLKKEI